MTDKRKIKTLQDLIDSLSKENDSLREENRRLYEQIHILQDAEKDNYDHMHNAVSELNKKKDEYDELIRRCKQTQAGYEELNKEMSQMMSDYKRDMMEVMKINARKVFGGKRK